MRRNARAPEGTKPSKRERIRLDRLLVARGLAQTREKAAGMILAGEVTVDGMRSDKPGAGVRTGALIELAPVRRKRVGRGGDKLEGALDAFALDVTGRHALDIGASTGGFTECLLQRGAAGVIALDVGHGQLDWSLRCDPRVVPLEGVNARYLKPADLPELAGRVDLVVCDVSFISVGLILPAIAHVLPHGEAVVLVKPQFEAGRGKVGRGGILRDDAAREAAVRNVVTAAIGNGFTAVAACASRLPGAEGNRELFLYLRRTDLPPLTPPTPAFETSLERALTDCRISSDDPHRKRPRRKPKGAIGRPPGK